MVECKDINRHSLVLAWQCCFKNIFSQGWFAVGYHLAKADDHHVGPTIGAFISEYGIPQKLTMDGAAVQVGRKTTFMSTICRNQINYVISQPYWPDQNPAEGGIREIKRCFYRIEQKCGVPQLLWDFTLDYMLETMNVTVNSSRYSNRRTQLEIATGKKDLDHLFG